MPDFKILATNHTSFTVSDLDRSVAFFRDALGFEVTSKAPRDPQVVSKITGIEGTEMMIAYVRGAQPRTDPVPGTKRGPRTGARSAVRRRIRARGL